MDLRKIKSKKLICMLFAASLSCGIFFTNANQTVLGLNCLHEFIREHEESPQVYTNLEQFRERMRNVPRDWEFQLAFDFACNYKVVFYNYISEYTEYNYSAGQWCANCAHALMDYCLEHGKKLEFNVNHLRGKEDPCGEDYTVWEDSSNGVSKRFIELSKTHPDLFAYIPKEK